LSRQDYEKAEQYFENAVKFEPTNSIFFLNSGVCYFKQNKYKLARESFFDARKYLYKAKTDYGK
jgi:Tfp pilus assembly protein PilF